MTATLWNALIAALIVGVANGVGTGLANVLRTNLGRTGLDPEVRRLVTMAVRWGVVAIAAIPALAQLGVEPSGIVAVLGAASLAIGLALKSTLSNVASGAILLTLRPLREGDWVEAGGREGTVTVLFTDLVESTQLNQTLGDIEARRIGRQVEEMARDAVATNRGALSKEMGEG